MKPLLLTLFCFGVLFTKAADDKIGKPDPNKPAAILAESKNEKLLRAWLAVNQLLQSDTATSAVLAYTKSLRTVDAYFFPGTSRKTALVIGGVHGSELSAIEVANGVVNHLKKSPKPYYSVIVVPCLFPDNAAMAKQWPGEIGSVKNIGRYTNGVTADPNRQMPVLGTGFREEGTLDMAGREIEMENQILLQLIQVLKPDRIASVHAIRNENSGGVYADPRTDCQGFALGYQTDSSLAVQMARKIEKEGGIAPGNHLSTSPTALYACDPEIAETGLPQKRNFHGSHLAGNRGYGVSLGSWASTGVCDEKEDCRREAAILLTVEFPGNKRPQDHQSEVTRNACKRNVQAYASAISHVFLQEL